MVEVPSQYPETEGTDPRGRNYDKGLVDRPQRRMRRNHRRVAQQQHPVMPHDERRRVSLVAGGFNAILQRCSLPMRSVPPWALVGIALIAAVGCVGLMVLLRQGRRGLAGWTAFSGIGLVIALITLTPSGDPFDASRCALEVWTPILHNQLISLSNDELNVWVFAFLGIAVAALPGRNLVFGAGITLLGPPVIEWIQYLLPVLGRSCQSTDLANNWAGGVAGLAVAAATRALKR